MCEGSGTQGKENFWRAAGKRGREAPLQAIPIPSGAAISPLPSASLKQRVLQGGEQTRLLLGKASPRGTLVNQAWGLGVRRQELSCRQRGKPGMTGSAQHAQGATHVKHTVGLGLLFQVY